MKLLIKNGRVIDPANGLDQVMDLLAEDGKILCVKEGIELPEDTEVTVIDASGKIVAPGFIDIHMHEDPIVTDERGTHLYDDEEKAIFACMLRMGVTTAVAGNCGDNFCDPGKYLDQADEKGAFVNIGMLAGHGYFRYEAGGTDKYAPITREQKQKMAEGIRKALDAGCLGVSFGIRYVPGTDREELLMAAGECSDYAERHPGKEPKMIAAHIRDDAANVFSAQKEFLDIAKELGIKGQVSHIGSMAGFGQMKEFLSVIDQYREEGVDAMCDCYPYYAFSTSIGSTTYDPGWLERYQCDYSVLEFPEGKYKGQRATKETFDEIRRDHPEYETVCYVMKKEDVDMAFAHPAVMIGSDGIFSSGQGHPRAAGAFPRFLSHFVRDGEIDLYTGISKVTTMAAKRLGLANKGNLTPGSDADITIFDYEKLKDGATFKDPALPPEGIDYVIIAGEIACEKGGIVNGHLGKSIRG